MVSRRVKRKQEVAAHARQARERDRIVNRWGAVRWVAQRIGDGALPTLGKLAAAVIEPLFAGSHYTFGGVRMRYVLDRLRERSTWAAIIGAVLALTGYNLPAEHADLLMMGGAALASAAAAAVREK